MRANDPAFILSGSQKEARKSGAEREFEEIMAETPQIW